MSGEWITDEIAQELKLHPFLRWAQLKVIRHLPCDKIDCAICTAKDKDEAVQKILDKIDSADRLDVVYGIVEFPSQEEVSQAFIWWATGGKDEWEGRERKIWSD